MHQNKFNYGRVNIDISLARKQSLWLRTNDKIESISSIDSQTLIP